MKKIIYTIIALAAAGLASCTFDRSPSSGNYDPEHPGFEYNVYGDMYYSLPYDAMTQFEYNDNPYNPFQMTMRMPPKGTVARGQMANHYNYTNDAEGYEKAGAEVKSPLIASADIIAQGKLKYETFCWQCHGKEGEGKGLIVAAKKIAPPTWDFENLDLLKTLPDGKMYHSITYGRNLMGPHATIVTPEDRWKIIAYLKKMALGAPSAEAAAPADSSATATQPTDSTAQAAHN